MSLPDNVCCSSTELPMIVARIGQWSRSSSPGEQMADAVIPPFNEANTAGWIDFVAGQANLETEQEHLPYRGFGLAVKRAAPLVLQIADSGEPTFVVIIGARGEDLIAVSRDLKRVRLHCRTLRDLLFRRQRAAVLPEVERLLLYAGVSNHRRDKSLELLLEDRLADHRATACWNLRLRGGAGIWRQASDVRLPGSFARLMTSYAAAYVLWLISWWVLGFSALQGRFDGGWIGVWALLLVTMIPLRLWATWMQGVTATGAGWVCRQKLLHATLQMNPDEMRSHGIGHFLGRALELEAIETVGFSGGVLGVVSLIELAAAAVVLGMGAAPFSELVALLVWAGAVSAFLLYYFRCRRRWTGLRLEMTHDLIERIVGHRTRIVQETPERWHTGEDEALENYFLASKKMDRIAALLNALATRGWVLLSMIALAPAVTGGSASTFSIAITLGGVLIASEALRKVVTSMIQLADTSIAWQRVQPLLASEAEPLAPAAPFQTAAEPVQDAASASKLIEFRDVRFQHRGRPQPVLQSCQLNVFNRDRLLLEGSSGCGKSSLVSILAGLRSPDSGLLLLNGLDRHTLGPSGWRRKVVAAPQFHENHIFSETFAFNLLMGRRWPASAQDLREAEAVCNELGLTDLLNRMPAGLMQMVGETGWQLSHGERSRVFMARALLQNADMVVLDESFAALDPENLRRCVDCVVNRAKTLMVVAHP